MPADEDYYSDDENAILMKKNNIMEEFEEKEQNKKDELIPEHTILKVHRMDVFIAFLGEIPYMTQCVVQDKTKVFFRKII